MVTAGRLTAKEMTRTSVPAVARSTLPSTQPEPASGARPESAICASVGAAASVGSAASCGPSVSDGRVAIDGVAEVDAAQLQQYQRQRRPAREAQGQRSVPGQAAFAPWSIQPRIKPIWPGVRQAVIAQRLPVVSRGIAQRSVMATTSL